MGPLLVVVSAVCFGATAVFGKFAYAAGVDTATVLQLRFVLAAAVLGVLLVAVPRLRRPVPTTGHGRSRRRAVVVALALGAVGYTTQAGCYFAALHHLDAALVALLLYTFPVLVAAGATLLGRERSTPTRTAAVVVASGGTALVLLGSGTGALDRTGVALALIAAVAYSGYILVADTVVGVLPPVVFASLIMTGAATTMTARTIVSGGPDLGFAPVGWLWIGAIVLVSTVAAILTFFAGLARTGPTATSVLSTFEPLVTAGLAALALGKFLSPVQLAGGSLVLAATVTVAVKGRHGTRTVPATGAASAGAPLRAVAAVPDLHDLSGGVDHRGDPGVEAVLHGCSSSARPA